MSSQALHRELCKKLWTAADHAGAWVVVVSNDDTRVVGKMKRANHDRFFHSTYGFRRRARPVCPLRGWASEEASLGNLRTKEPVSNIARFARRILLNGEPKQKTATRRLRLRGVGFHHTAPIGSPSLERLN